VESAECVQDAGVVSRCELGIWNHWMRAVCAGAGRLVCAEYVYSRATGSMSTTLKTYGHPSKAGFMELTNFVEGGELEA